MHADHQNDPTAFNVPGSPQDIYAQCDVCSGEQSLAARIGQRILRNHGIINPEGRLDDLMQILRDHPEHIVS
jgi:hypothetical protein